MPNFIVQALFLQAFSTSPIRFAFKGWEEEWLLTEDQFGCLYNYCTFFIWSLQANGMPQYVLIELWEPIVSKWHFSSAILWQISDGQYFFAFDQTHTYLGGSASNSISEVSPYNEVWQTRSQVTSLFGREPFALNLRHVYLAASSLARLECNRAWHAWTRECHPHCNALHIMASPYLVRSEFSVRITVPCGL